jgi:glycosyltransferase involved in cell wall biosynthesis
VSRHIAVVVPSYNEARTIGAIVKRLKEREFVVYVIDDGSQDDTEKRALAEGAIVIRNPKNIGKGGALKEGFRRVVADGFDMALIMDGDDQHDVTDIAHLIKRMRETHADMIVGNRMTDTSGMPLVRIAVNRFMSWLISVISGQYVPDTQCGFRLIKSGVLKNITFESNNYEIESEMIVKAARAGFKINSTNIKTVYQDEVSRINPVIDTLRFIRLMLKLIVKGRRDVHK